MPDIDRLLEIMARLRDPEQGCPWDLEQTFRTIAPYTIEEAYEVADAIERDDLDELRDELGDLLFQVVFYARMAQERDRFDFAGVVDTICEKMVRRHPHVFGEVQMESAEAQTRAWEKLKADERRERAARRGERHSLLDNVSVALPGLTRAVKLQRRAARVGMDWPEIHGVLDKIQEELDELRAELRDATDPERVESEIGDLLFSCANLARHVEIDPESAVRTANAKFEQRFRAMEDHCDRQNLDMHDMDAAQLDALWEQVKSEEQP